MRTKSIIKSLVLLISIGLVGFGCRPETEVQPKSNGLDMAALGDTVHTTPDTICGTNYIGNIVDAAGNLGSGNIFGADLYGTYEVIGTPTEMFLQVSLGRGWFVKQAYIYMGSSTNIPRLNDGNVDAENLPINATVSPVRNLYEVTWPISGSMQCPAENYIYAQLTIVELDFLNTPYNDTPVWCQASPIASPTGTNGAQWFSYCAVPCGNTGPEETTLTAGECRRCDSENTVTFIGCDSVYVSSCKDLSNLVLGLDDCSTTKFDGLKTAAGGWAAPAGRSIVKAWVKSGCNDSGDGPGFGRAFDNPNTCAQAYNCAGNWVVQ